MAQLFHRSANSISKISLAAAVLGAGGLLAFAYTMDRGRYITDVKVVKEQPVPFSHKHHVTDDGIDCRYCHTSVETSSFAGVPATEICMSCHSQIWSNAEILEPVRASFRTGESLRVDPCPRPAGFRILQPQHPYQQRRRMRHLPWPRGPDAADVQGKHAVHELVRQLSPQSREVCAPARSGVQHGV